MLVEEYLHGRLHRMRLKITDVQEGRGFTYRIFPGMGGRFRMEPGTRGTEFVAEMLIGWSLRGVSFLLDLLIRILFSRRFEALQEHMKEEGLNLRALLRAGSSAVRPA